MKEKLNVAIVGLEFGKEFIPIYQRYPHTNMYAVCQRSREKLDRTGDDFGVEVRYADYAELLRDPEVDVVHINTPLQIHADQVVAALEAGKHVGCTIPMATSVADCKRIVDAAEKSGRVYMMMETVVYSREYLFVKELFDKGELGDIQFIRASHQQEMWGWPDYWHGMPPMHNATHAISPCLSIGMWEAESVSCLGAGRVQEFMIPKYGSPFAIETTHIRFKGSPVGAEVTRSLFNTARQYREHFDVFGSKKTFEWTQVEGEDHVIHTGEDPARVKIPDYAHRLPGEIRGFTTGGVYDAGDSAHRSFIQGGGHGGSHPHLVHELVSAIREGRDPYPNARQAANITCAGILSHESAMQGGKTMPLPEWTLWKNKPMLSRPAAWAKKAAVAAALALAFAFGAAAPAQAEEEGKLNVSGYGWTQYINGLTPMFKGAANFDYNPFVSGGGMLFLESKASERWTANLALGVAFGNTAIKKTIRDSNDAAIGKTNPHSISMNMGAFLHEANLAYGNGPYSLKIGRFHYVYSDYNTNMGLYLLRGPVYPGFIYSGFDEIGTLAKTGLLSSWSPVESLRWDVLASFETDFKPYMDLNLSSFVAYKMGPFELGAGVEAQRLVEFNPCVTSPRSAKDVEGCLGGDATGPTYVGPGADLYLNLFSVIDTVGDDDTTTYSLAGTKVMARGAVDFKQIFAPNYPGSARDLILYAEVALLGVKNYDHIYEKRSERMPVLVGLNVPTFGWLDLLSLEVEYYNAPFQNDPYRLVGSYDPFDFSDGNNTNYAMSPIPPSNSSDKGGNGENLSKTDKDFDPARDNWKWSLLAAKRVDEKITLKVQVASDHWRVPNSNLVQYEAMANPKQFYGAIRIAYSL